MKPTDPVPTKVPSASQPQKGGEPQPDRADPKLDRELDQELDGTYPASDPLPWSHEVK
jgi:hypothetical protein